MFTTMTILLLIAVAWLVMRPQMMAYSTTPTHGKVARVEKGDTAVAFTEGWKINFGISSFADITSQGDAWETGLPGFGKWSGSFSGWLALGNTQQKALHDNLVTAAPGTKLTDMKFLINGSTEGWDGDVYIESVDVDAQKGDSVKLTVNFRGDGAPTLSDAQ